MKLKMLNYFKIVCNETAKLSTCQSKQVGAVLTRNARILAIAYNGTAAETVHCKDMNFKNREEHIAWSLKNELHAEQNLIAFCAKNNISTNETILFLSLSPCISCAKLIFASGIRKIYYLEEYDRDREGLKFLADNNIMCELI